MLSLKDRKWSAFKIESLFSVSRPVPRSKDHYKTGNVPFVASGSVNNGVVKLCKPSKNEELDKAGCITVSPVDGSAFYQSFDFLGRGGAGSSILILRCHSLNSYSGRFVARMVSQTCSKYMYGHMGNTKSIKREQIMLPVDETNAPDWQFMEDYIREREAIQINRLFSFLEHTIAETERERESRRHLMPWVEGIRYRRYLQREFWPRYICSRKNSRKHTLCDSRYRQ